MSEQTVEISPSHNIKSRKEALRQAMRKEKNSRSRSQLAEMSRQITEHLEQNHHFKTATTVLMYYALPDEVQTQDLINRWYRHKMLLLPRVDGNELTLHVYDGPKSLKEGAFHILEPTTPEFSALNKIELAVVPGMAFDLSGHRLGRGRGYYDRLLPRLTCHDLYRIGLAFPFQMVPHIPCEAHDIGLDSIITLEK